MEKIPDNPEENYTIYLSTKLHSFLTLKNLRLQFYIHEQKASLIISLRNIRIQYRFVNPFQKT